MCINRAKSIVVGGCLVSLYFLPRGVNSLRFCRWLVTSIVRRPIDSTAELGYVCLYVYTIKRSKDGYSRHHHVLVSWYIVTWMVLFGTSFTGILNVEQFFFPISKFCCYGSFIGYCNGLIANKCEESYSLNMLGQ